MALHQVLQTIQSLKFFVSLGFKFFLDFGTDKVLQRPPPLQNVLTAVRGCDVMLVPQIFLPQ